MLAGEFWTYPGSLTTPGCGGGVAWFVLAAPGAVSVAAVTRYRQVIGRFPGYGGYRGNNRPVQPLGDRAVRFRSEVPSAAPDG